MAPKRDEDLRQAALAALGPEAFDRLVVSVADARRAGRLRFWQEQLLARIPGEKVRFEDFVVAFEGASLQRPRPPAPAAGEGTGKPPEDWKKNAPAWVQEEREINEAEWLAGPHLIWMVSFLINRSNDRRHLLFGCACCREVWDLLQYEPARKLVELCEAFVDGDIREADFKAAAATVSADLQPQFRGLAGSGQLSARALHAIVGAWHLASDNFRRSQGAYAIAQETCKDARTDFTPTAGRPMNPKGGYLPPDQGQIQEKVKLLRDIFGNPFRPTAFSRSWRTATAVALARRMYESRDFSAMPILADALEDAGCDSADVLDHCRGPGPHVRGCHVVDLLLGKK
jgi:hypothetical protein